ncbi:MAG: hypothetical protein H7062_08350 [Candidatus Saccharimonas sp.]|nr:hypothetical protein [Planctomycetaceae bacterium]
MFDSFEFRASTPHTTTLPGISASGVDPHQNEAQYACGHSVHNEAPVATPEREIENQWLRRLSLQVIHRHHRGEHDAEIHQEHSDPEPIPKSHALRRSSVLIVRFVL